jgi:hypothetical protein
LILASEKAARQFGLAGLLVSYAAKGVPPDISTGSD